MKQPKLDDARILSELEKLNSVSIAKWAIVRDKLYKQFVFKNFIGAMGFMTQSAIIAEKMNHHPEWSNVYKTVDVYLVTHSSNGITQLDFELATKMQSLAKE